MTVTGDLLTAAGLLLATIGLVFSAWYKEIKAAADLTVADKHDDRHSAITTVRAALWSRAVPLLVAVSLLVVALAPPAVSVVWHASSEQWGNSYDAVRALFVGTWLLTLALAAVLTEQLWKLDKKLRDLNGPDR